MIRPNKKHSGADVPRMALFFGVFWTFLVFFVFLFAFFFAIYEDICGIFTQKTGFHPFLYYWLYFSTFLAPEQVLCNDIHSQPLTSFYSAGSSLFIDLMPY